MMGPGLPMLLVSIICCTSCKYHCVGEVASNFYCMAIAAEPSLPSGLPSATDWAAASIAAALETSVNASAVVASAAIAAAVADAANHPRNGHGVNNCLHDDGHLT
jgi:hypothetical protein